jgi:hypothetical protein
MIDQARLLTLKAAWMMDTAGNKERQGRDRDDQGGGAQHGLPGDRLGDAGARRRGVSDDFPLAYFYALRARCALPTAPTRCTATRSPRSSLRPRSVARWLALRARLSSPTRRSPGSPRAAPRAWLSRTGAASAAARAVRGPQRGAQHQPAAADHQHQRVAPPPAPPASASVSGPSSHCAASPPGCRQRDEAIAQCPQLVAGQLGEHHQPAHLGRRLVVDARLHALDVLLEHRLLHRLLQLGVQHHHLQIGRQPQLGAQTQFLAVQM